MVVALAMQAVGVPLISAPSSSPLRLHGGLAPAPKVWALGASLIGVLSVIGGLLALLSLGFTPAGPAIVTTSLGPLCLSALLPRRQ